VAGEGFALKEEPTRRAQASGSKPSGMSGTWSSSA
jgi:hypothetical protein